MMPIFIKGKWIEGGSAFRVWYAINGTVKVVDATGMTSWEIQKALSVRG